MTYMEKKPLGGIVASVQAGILKMGPGGYTVFEVDQRTMDRLEVNPVEFITIYIQAGFWVLPNKINGQLHVTIFATDGLSTPFLQLHPELGKRVG